MRAIAVVLLVTLMCSLATAAEEWQPAGTILVNGKKVEGNFLRKGHRIVFPVQAVAAALGRTATVDAAAGAVSWNGKTTVVKSLAIVGGVAYATWIDISRLEPGLEFGVRG